MKGFLTACLLSLFSTVVYVSIPEAVGIPDSGVCVVEFNASFNSSNSVDWLDELSDCKGKRVDIAASPDLQKKHKIVVVPTIIVFNDGDEVKRFQANIMMQLEATKDEVQEAVDEIIMSAF
mgnify:FL=1|tara:strand:+ start:61 stop:423 length:363 start_codon:yes stop_codon:yes gene_type:complete